MSNQYLSSNIPINPKSIGHTIEDLTIENTPSYITVSGRMYAQLIDGCIVLIQVGAVRADKTYQDGVLGYIKIPEGKQIKHLVGRVGSADNKTSYHTAIDTTSDGYGQILVARLSTEDIYGTIVGMFIDK